MNPRSFEIVNGPKRQFQDEHELMVAGAFLWEAAEAIQAAMADGGYFKAEKADN